MVMSRLQTIDTFTKISLKKGSSSHFLLKMVCHASVLKRGHFIPSPFVVAGSNRLLNSSRFTPHLGFTNAFPNKYRSTEIMKD